jgi:hypothetical protein
MIAPSATDPIGWTQSSREVSAAGRRGSELVMRSHPST